LLKQKKASDPKKQEAKNKKREEEVRKP